MELLQLRYFCDAAVSENFSRTAKKFNVPASNISQSIRRLENELSISLFIRSANRVYLSERGAEFYKEIKTALDIIDHAKNDISGNLDHGTIHIGIYVNRRIVMQAIEKYQLEYPHINIITHHDVAGFDENLDIVIADKSLEVWDYYKEKVMNEEIILAAKKGMIHCDGTVKKKDIQDKPFITMSEGNNIYTILEQVSAELGFVPRIALQSQDPFYIRQCVELGLGVVLAPSISWRGQFSDLVEFYKLGDVERETFVYRRNGRYTPKFVNDFYKILKAEFENEMKNV